MCSSAPIPLSGIYYTNDEQKAIAEKVLKEVAANPNFLKAFHNAPPVTEIVKFEKFYNAGKRYDATLVVSSSQCSHNT